MMDDDRFIKTWLNQLTIWPVIGLAFIGTMLATRQPESFIIIILITVLSIAVVISLTTILQIRLEAHKENKNGGAFISAIYKFFAQE